MKIAMIGQKGIPATYGGVERHVHDLSVHLAEAGHEVTVYSRKWYTRGKDGLYEGVRVKHLPSLRTKHLDTISHTMLATFHAIWGRADVLHYHGVGPALLAWLPRLLAPKKRVLITFHSIDRYHQKWVWLARQALRLGEWAACTFAHVTITVSPTLQSYCKNEFRKDTIYIPSGVPTQQHPYSNGDDTLDNFELKRGQYLLTVGRLVPCKATHVLIEAFIKLKKTVPSHPAIADLKLVIVGGSVYTDDYVRELHRQAKQCTDIIFTDWQSGGILSDLFRHATLIVQPSLIEGHPLAVLEAMSHQKAVLASNIPEHYDLIQDGRLLFRPNDTTALNAAVLDWLFLPDDAQTVVAKRNYHFVNTNFSWKAILPSILSIYQSDTHLMSKKAEISLASTTV